MSRLRRLTPDWIERAGTVVEPNQERSWRLRAEAPGTLADLVKDARKAPWLLRFLQVFWVAGPATFIAMQAAYYLGFGRLAPVENVIYFMLLTLILGVIAIISGFLSGALTKKRNEAATDVLRGAIDLLPDLLLVFRDIDLAAMTPEKRRQRAAAALLNELDLGPDALVIGVRDLTGDASLAQVAQQIEIFRRLGLRSRVRDLVEATTDARLAALARMYAESPDCVEVLRWRLLGDAPNPDQGLARREGFLQRLLLATETDVVEGLDVADVREILLLAFELLSGREIRYLRFRFRGFWRRERSLDTLERARQRQQVAQARVLNQLRSLALEVTRIQPVKLERSALRQDAATLATHLLDALEPWLGVRPPRGSADARTMASVLRGLRALQRERDAWKDAVSEHDEALDDWCLQKRHPKLLRRLMSALGKERNEIEILEDSIVLDSEQRIHVAEGIARIVQTHDLNVDGVEAAIGGAAIERGDMFRIGIEVLTVLQNVLDLTHPAIQRAIAATPAIWSGGLHMAMSAEDKAQMGAALVKELPEDLAPLAERLAVQLRMLYQINLDEPLVEFLVQRYGANRDRLDTLRQNPPPESGAPPVRRIQPWEEVLRSRRWSRLLARNAER